MRALTLRQPWAHAVAHLGKRVENRGWSPPAHLVEEVIAIHAGVTVDEDDALHLVDLGHELPRELVRGAVIAVAVLEGVVTREDALPDDQRRWWVGPFGWVLADVVALPKPVPCRGAQGLWAVPLSVKIAVRAQLSTQPPGASR